MTEYICKCPCCNNKLKIQADDSNSNIAVFLFEKNNISQKDLFEKYGIELGVIEKGGE